MAFTDKNGIVHVWALDASGYIHEGMQTARNANTFTSWVDGYFGGHAEQRNAMTPRVSWLGRP